LTIKEVISKVLIVVNIINQNISDIISNIVLPDYNRLLSFDSINKTIISYIAIKYLNISNLEASPLAYKQIHFDKYIIELLNKNINNLNLSL
jgi:hypothetical protein